MNKWLIVIVVVIGLVAFMYWAMNELLLPPPELNNEICMGACRELYPETTRAQRLRANQCDCFFMPHTEDGLIYGREVLLDRITVEKQQESSWDAISCWVPTNTSEITSTTLLEPIFIEGEICNYTIEYTYSNLTRLKVDTPSWGGNKHYCGKTDSQYFCYVNNTDMFQRLYERFYCAEPTYCKFAINPDVRLDDVASHELAERLGYTKEYTPILWDNETRNWYYQECLEYVSWWGNYDGINT